MSREIKSLETVYNYSSLKKVENVMSALDRIEKQIDNNLTIK